MQLQTQRGDGRMSTSPVEHVQVEAGEHAFSRASCRERATSAHHHVEHREGDEVILLKRKKIQHFMGVCSA